MAWAWVWTGTGVQGDRTADDIESTKIVSDIYTGKTLLVALAILRTMYLLKCAYKGFGKRCSVCSEARTGRYAGRVEGGAWFGWRVE